MSDEGIQPSFLSKQAFLTFFFLTTAFGTLAVTPLYAQDDFDLTVNQTFVYDSNPLMIPGNTDDIYGSETKATLNYLKNEQNRVWQGNLAVVRNQFDNSDFNSTDFYSMGEYVTSTPRARLALKGEGVYNTTRNGEETTLGLITNNSRRLRWAINPVYNYKINQRTDGGIEARYEQTKYDLNTLTDFHTISLVPSATYALNQQQNLIASFQTRRYEPLNDTQQSVNSFGPYFGWEYNFHPKYSIVLYGGMLGTQYKNYAFTDENLRFNPIYSARLTRSGETNQSSLSLSRARQAYATGIESDLTTLEASNITEINNAWSFNIRALYQNTENSDIPATNIDSAIEESVALNYKIGPKWDLSLSQKYRNETYVTTTDDADRHIVRIGLTYNFNTER